MSVERAQIESCINHMKGQVKSVAASIHDIDTTLRAGVDSLVAELNLADSGRATSDTMVSALRAISMQVKVSEGQITGDLLGAISGITYTEEEYLFSSREYYLNGPRKYKN